MSAASSTSLFGGTTLNHTGTLPPAPQPPSLLSSASLLPDAGSPASSDNTYIMPNTPARSRSTDGYRPKVVRTMGQRPACLVNASVTYCGNNQIYAFGGFDQYTDEVYNHVLKLDLATNQWNLVDNYGDIPGVRMGKWREPHRRRIRFASRDLEWQGDLQTWVANPPDVMVPMVKNRKSAVAPISISPACTRRGFYV